MTYAVSDVHGCYDKYLKMLETIGFSDDDVLYVLGDVIDRGDGGIDILFDMMKRKNVIPLKGNHEFLAVKLLKTLGEKYESESQDHIIEGFKLWFSDGGRETFERFILLDEETQKKLLFYMGTFDYYAETDAGGNSFFLSHTLPAWQRRKPISGYPIMDFIVGEPSYDKEYIKGTYTVTGHTPTGYIDPDSDGKVWRGNGHIAIDCGAVFGGNLACLCLDTLEVTYI